MKLLFDQNLSPLLVRIFEKAHPGSTHVREIGLRDASDDEIWRFAREHGFTIVTKDYDYVIRELVLGHPPKIICVRLGNCSNQRLISILRQHAAEWPAFAKSERGCLIVGLHPMR